MKCFVKILFFPIIFLLSILTAFLRFLLGIGTMVLSLFEIIILLGAIEAFVGIFLFLGDWAIIIRLLLAYGLSNMMFFPKEIMQWHISQCWLCYFYQC